MNRHWEAQTRNYSLVMVNVRFTTQRRAPAVDAGLCFCLDINKRRKRVEPTEHLAKPHPPPQQRLAGCSDSSLSPSLFLYVSLPPSQAERSVTPITAFKAINRDPTHFMCPKRPKKTEAGYKQPALVNCSRLNSIKMCGSEDVIQYIAQYSQTSSPPSLAPQDNKRLNKYVK